MLASYLESDLKEEAMKAKYLLVTVLCLAVLALAACGSSNDNTAETTTIPATGTVISGLASKGPINGGAVKVFAIRSGVTDTSVPIASGTTDAVGNFTVDAGNFTGSVMVEVTGGTFKDEVTGAQVALKAPMRTIIDAVSKGTKTAAVTPLTELATKRAHGHAAMTPAIINECNANVGATFNVPDIVSTLPVVNGTPEQKKHAAACGSISQLVNNRRHAGESTDDALARVMSDMGNEVEHNGGLSDDSLNAINAAITEFNNSGHNETGTTIPAAAPSGGVLKISTAGTAAAIGALDMTVNLPAGTTVTADPVTGEAAPGTITVSGAAVANGGSQVAAKVTPAAGGAPGKVVISMINPNGFGAGECMTIDFKLETGAAFPVNASAFSMTGVAAKALDGTPITGVTAAPTSLAAM
jgi:hypothetical protein